MAAASPGMLSRDMGTAQMHAVLAEVLNDPDVGSWWPESISADDLIDARRDAMWDDIIAVMQIAYAAKKSEEKLDPTLVMKVKKIANATASEERAAKEAQAHEREAATRAAEAARLAREMLGEMVPAPGAAASAPAGAKRPVERGWAARARGPPDAQTPKTLAVVPARDSAVMRRNFGLGAMIRSKKGETDVLDGQKNGIYNTLTLRVKGIDAEKGVVKLSCLQHPTFNKPTDDRAVAVFALGKPHDAPCSLEVVQELQKCLANSADGAPALVTQALNVKKPLAPLPSMLWHLTLRGVDDGLIIESFDAVFDAASPQREHELTLLIVDSIIKCDAAVSRYHMIAAEHGERATTAQAVRGHRALAAFPDQPFAGLSDPKEEPKPGACTVVLLFDGDRQLSPSEEATLVALHNALVERTVFVGCVPVKTRITEPPPEDRMLLDTNGVVHFERNDGDTDMRDGTSASDDAPTSDGASISFGLADALDQIGRQADIIHLTPTVLMDVLTSPAKLAALQDELKEFIDFGVCVTPDLTVLGAMYSFEDDGMPALRFPTVIKSGAAIADGEKLHVYCVAQEIITIELVSVGEFDPSKCTGVVSTHRKSEVELPLVKVAEDLVYIERSKLDEAPFRRWVDEKTRLLLGARRPYGKIKLDEQHIALLAGTTPGNYSKRHQKVTWDLEPGQWELDLGMLGAYVTLIPSDPLAPFPDAVLAQLPDPYEQELANAKKGKPDQQSMGSFARGMGGSSSAAAQPEEVQRFTFKQEKSGDGRDDGGNGALNGKGPVIERFLIQYTKKYNQRHLPRERQLILLVGCWRLVNGVGATTAGAVVKVKGVDTDIDKNVDPVFKRRMVTAAGPRQKKMGLENWWEKYSAPYRRESCCPEMRCGQHSSQRSKDKQREATCSFCDAEFWKRK